MPRPITWWRLYRGTEPEGSPETVGERAPANARVCPVCISTVRHHYALVLAAEQGVHMLGRR